MRVALVHAVREELLLRHVEAAGEALGKAHAQGEVAARVLVVERVVEQDAALADGRILGDERALAETTGVLVRVHDLLEHLVAALCPVLHHATALEAQPEVSDDLTGVHQGHGGEDNPVRAGAVRRGEDLLGRDVGEVAHAVDRGRRASLPDAAAVEPDREVGAVRSAIVQPVEGVAVEQRLVPLGWLREQS